MGAGSHEPAGGRGRHVTIGHGRDYDDVAPLRGTYVGPEASALDVAVRIRRAQQADAQQ